MHECGTWINNEGDLVNKYSDSRVSYYDMALVYDDEGVVLKCGDREMVDRYTAALIKGLGSLMGFTTLYFDRFDSFSPDEVCTMVNYMLNHIGIEGINNVLSMSEPALKAKLHKLAEMGF